jgi:hypothetical protein
MLSNPIFDSVMTKIKSMPESEWTSPTGKQLWRLAAKHTPPELNRMFIEGAQKEGLFPKPTHCDGNGDALYSLDEIAKFFGQTPEEAQAAYNEMLAADPDICDGIHSGPIYTLQ